MATGRAAAAADVTMIAAMLSTVTIEEIAATGAKLWFQLYIQPDLAFTESLVRRAEAAGCRALVVTVDSPALGRNERGDRNDFHDLPPGIFCANMGGDGNVRQVVLSPEISWRHLDWLRETTALPILLKGVLHPDDARIAVERGVGRADRVQPRRPPARHHAGHARPAAGDRRRGRRPRTAAARRRRAARHRRRQGAGAGRAGGGDRPPGAVGPGGGGRGRRRPGAGAAAQRAGERADPARRRRRRPS